MDEDVSTMTGENNFKRGVRYDEVTFQGTKGEFFLREKDAEKDETGKYPKISLGKELDIVFLKVRRILQAKYKKNTPIVRTSEHNSKGETVALFEGKDKIGTYVADSELSKGKGLFTHQIVYAYLPEKKEVVRVTLKGASLGSEKTAKGVMKFYDYMQSFTGEDHLHNFITKLVPVAEEGPQGEYYAIDFQRGERLDAETQAEVVSLIKQVHEAIQQKDERLKIGAVTVEESETATEEQEEESGGLKYPEEEINPEDIPF